jgi:hypothetical protein
MINSDYFIIPLIMGQVSHIINSLKTGYILIDCCMFGLLYLLYINVNMRDIKRRFCSLFRGNKINHTIILTALEHKRSIKFRAIMHYLSKKNESVYKVRELYDLYWDDDESQKVEKNSEYIVDQSKEFKMTDDIYGLIINNSKEKMRSLAGTEYIDVITLKIYSNKLTLIQLQDWVSSIVKSYKQHLKAVSNETQLYLTVSSGGNTKRKSDSSSSSSSKSKANELCIEATPWDSMITFENSYFHDMDAVIKKIDFFLNNKEWYLSKGISYNLGILLYGEPGCGKTRFIKQLMNHTGRHGIDIKLNDAMNFNDLYNIIFKEEINDDYIIPQDQRILIFEDIDAMGESVKCRDIKMKEKELKTQQSKKEEDKIDAAMLYIKQNMLNDNKLLGKETSSAPIIADIPSTKSQEDGNNLSYLLNMFDGINECSGRIIIMTSNKPEVLDKALIRPGRIDIKINFQRCTRYDVMRLINLFWSTVYTEEMILADLEMKYTSADIYNIFRTTDDFSDIIEMFII